MKRIHFTACRSTKETVSAVDGWRIYNPYHYLKAKGCDVTLDFMELNKENLMLQFQKYDVEHIGYHPIKELQDAHLAMEKNGMIVSMDFDDDLYHLEKKYGNSNPQWKLVCDRSKLSTVTTPYLAQVIHYTKKQRMGYDDTRYTVLPNLIDLEQYRAKPKIKKSHLTIGYMGSGYHLFDFVESGFFQALQDILKKYPHVHFECFGMNSVSDLPLRINKVWEWKTDYNHYVEYFRQVAAGWDIGVAPLETNIFSMSKSNIKWLEYSALGVPTIAQNYHPYFSIEDDRTGLFATNQEDWFNAMELLIQNQSKRLELASNALKEVKKNWSLKAKGYIYENYFNSL